MHMRQWHEIEAANVSISMSASFVVCIEKFWEVSIADKPRGKEKFVTRQHHHSQNGIAQLRGTEKRGGGISESRI